MTRIHPAGRWGAAVAAALAALVLAALPAAAARPAGGAPALSFTQVLKGYERPVVVTSTGEHNRRIFIVEQTGRIRIATYSHGTWKKLGTFLDLSARVIDPNLPDQSERGLLGLAFDPDYATNGRFYVNYTRKASGGKNGDTVIREYRRASTNRADPASGRTVLVLDQPYANHNGGNLAFGPDGYLYIGMGDGGSGGDPQGRAQNLASPLGKLLRIDPADPDGSGPLTYSVPASNPFVGQEGKRPEIWAYGLRNPWRWSFDRGTGDLWIGDVGQNLWEEVDHLPATAGVDAGKGVNLGWNVCEADRTYPGGTACDSAGNGFVAPVAVYSHANGCAVTGGNVFRGPDAPAWRGAYVYADFCDGTVTALGPTGTQLLSTTRGAAISAFGEDAAGRLFVVHLGGTIDLVSFTGDPFP